MPDLTVEVEIYCADCGEGLCNQTEFAVTRNRGTPSFRVEACKRCLENAREEGREEAREEADRG